MTSSVAILFTMDTRKVPGSILQEADERHQKKAKEQFRNFLDEKYKTMTNVILENLPSVNGLPLSAFLNRMRGVIPLNRYGMAPLEKMIEDEVEKILNVNQDPTAGVHVTHEDKIQAVRTLCRLAADPNDREVFSEWLGSNAARLNEGIANCLGTEHRDLTQETCFAIAYLARAFRFRLFEKMDVVIAALVRAMAIALIPWETYVEQYRDAKERHNDIELARGRPIIFHHPRMEYQFADVNHRVLGCIYYTLGDLLFSCPTPKLIHFFECRIFRRKEMTRNLLFTILHVVVVNLTELQSEAERLAALTKQPSSLTVQGGHGMTPLMSRRGKIYSETMWNELAANLYSDIIRVYNDRNRANKLLINEIMAMLRAHAPEKLPMFEEATLKALELYTGSGGGRLTETYQIGRPTAGEGSAATGQRRRKSGILHEPGVQPMGGKTTGGQGASGLGQDKSAMPGDASSTGRPSRTLVSTLDAQQAEQAVEIASTGSSTVSLSDGNYSSESNRQETKISRRTIIVPKIPDLMQPNRVYRK